MSRGGLRPRIPKYLMKYLITRSPDADRPGRPADPDLRRAGRPHPAGHARPAGVGGGHRQPAGRTVRRLAAGDLAAPQGARTGRSRRPDPRGPVATQPAAGRPDRRGRRLAPGPTADLGLPDGPARGAPAPD